MSGDKRSYLFVFGGLLISTGVWIVFKIFYPYPGMVFDSYSYINAAIDNLSVNSWPVGYSKFLRFVGFFTHSANALVSIQYFLLIGSCGFFFHTWRTIFRPGKWVTGLVFILLFVNPLFCYCSNLVLSDALFISLSLLWFTLLIRVLFRPRPWMIPTHALLLVLAFTVRYSALYYPLVAIPAILLSRQRLSHKVLAIALPLVLVGTFMIYTGGQVARVSGVRQFSPFGGWKLANNALYMYGHVDPDPSAALPPEFRALDSTVRRYFREEPLRAGLLDPEYTSGSYYMISPYTPLPGYMFSLYGRDQGLQEWLAVAPLYQSYGSYLIRKYPLAFARYFCWPNFLRYLLPPGEVLGSPLPYEMVEKYGAASAHRWFGLESISISDKYVEISTRILRVYPLIFMILHFAFLLSLLGFLLCRGPVMIGKPASYCVFLVAGLWLCDLGFSVLSAGIVLRYQIFLMVIELSFSLYFMEFTYRAMDRRQPTPRLLNNINNS